MVKLIAFFKRRTGLSVEEFQKHWRTRHSVLVVRQHGLRRYIQNHTLSWAYQDSEPVYDGVAEAWFDDPDALLASGMSPEYAATRADEPNFMVSGRIPFVIAAAHEIEV